MRAFTPASGSRCWVRPPQELVSPLSHPWILASCTLALMILTVSTVVPACSSSTSASLFVNVLKGTKDKDAKKRRFSQPFRSTDRDSVAGEFLDACLWTRSPNGASDHNCRGSLPFLSPSRGLRCPRNHPVFLWEILQQSLAASRQKVSPWTKAQYLAWSPPPRSTGFLWPPDAKSPLAPFTHLRHPNNEMNASNFPPQNLSLIPQNRHRPRAELPLEPASLEAIFPPLPPGLFNASRKSQPENASRKSLFSPLLSRVVHPTLAQSGDLLFKYTTTSSLYSPLNSARTPPPSNNIPKSNSGQHKNYDNTSLLTNDKNLGIEIMLPDSRPSLLDQKPSVHHQHEGKKELRTKLQTKPLDKWPLRPPSVHSNLVPRQSYIYPTSLTPIANRSPPSHL